MVSADLAAARSLVKPDGRVIAVFQPSDLARLEAFDVDLGKALASCDEAVLTGSPHCVTWAALERLSARVNNAGGSARHIAPDRSETVGDRPLVAPAVVHDDCGDADGMGDEGRGGPLVDGGLSISVAVCLLALEGEEQRSGDGFAGVEHCFAGVEHCGFGDLDLEVEDVGETAADDADDRGHRHGVQRGSPRSGGWLRRSRAGGGRQGSPAPYGAARVE
ncbi:hypothetical protein GCM10017771_79940 [Streptomyces capitiformicae]|uniref:Uncharacterized protein n=1 Tax=Streptomyces capitiformicae TaxID=2014920 RepID=A0A919DKI0_9ACTN|nr:hypothetical protein GCM10017771_79940 [Streptomyces capitiformicae]